MNTTQAANSANPLHRLAQLLSDRENLNEDITRVHNHVAHFSQANSIDEELSNSMYFLDQLGQVVKLMQEQVPPDAKN